MDKSATTPYTIDKIPSFIDCWRSFPIAVEEKFLVMILYHISHKDERHPFQKNIAKAYRGCLVIVVDFPGHPAYCADGGWVERYSVLAICWPKRTVSFRLNPNRSVYCENVKINKKDCQKTRKRPLRVSSRGCGPGQPLLPCGQFTFCAGDKVSCAFNKLGFKNHIEWFLNPHSVSKRWHAWVAFKAALFSKIDSLYSSFYHRIKRFG